MNYKGGLSYTKEHKLWRNIKTRCYNKNYYQYKDWGGRGIRLFDKWLNDSKSFIEYIKALPNYGEKGFQLDREDNNKNYEPGNLRWVTPHKQSCNRRKKSDNKTGYTGVFVCNGKYRVAITVNKNKTHLGYFKTIEEAVEARNKYIIENNYSEYEIQKYIPL